MPDDRMLILLIGGRRAGVITVDNDRYQLTYDLDWQASPGATPLSLSMPLAQRVHGDGVVRPFLWGLLPDNELVLDRWGRDYQVSPRNPFALLRHVGEDCAGAAQFARPERAEALLAGAGTIVWLTDDEIEQRLNRLHTDPAAWHAHKSGQFSLAGAQAKTALYRDPETGRWGEPTGAKPTTHILKPAVAGFDDHDLNEHLCLRTAANIGLPTAESSVASFGSERAIVIERYDRLRDAGGAVTRVHQEDLCQALGVMPTSKYQHQGGPTPEAIIAVLRRSVIPAQAAVAAVLEFTRALAVNWVLGGTDAHAKNYSVLLAGGQVRLAPMYDVASALPYEGMYLPKLKMAMKIGKHDTFINIKGRHWRAFAATNRLDPDQVVSEVDYVAAQLPEALAAALDDDAIHELRSPMPELLLDRLTARSEQCRLDLGH